MPGFGRMKIFFYCQHVLGIGHFFRALEICKALSRHEVILITGSPRPAAEVPDHVREVTLPGLQMNPDFSRLYPANDADSVENIKSARLRILSDLFDRGLPDVLIVELYPFGRKAFEFELVPMLEAIRSSQSSGTLVVCSLRDILVEKKDTEAYESRVVRNLNRYFDALLIHSDPEIASLDETFSSMSAIEIPIYYTGFVTPKPRAGDRNALRARMKLYPDDIYVVASAGGGRVGAALMESAILAFGMFKRRRSSRMSLFAGPYMDDEAFKRIEGMADRDVSVQRFSGEFLAHLAASDISISMAGYNTCMNLLAAGANALLWPFSQNREQQMRAEKLAKKATAHVLDNHAIEPSALAEVMDRSLMQGRPVGAGVNLDGALRTAKWIEDARGRK
jgi:predicted glycosyltransferase